MDQYIIQKVKKHRIITDQRFEALPTYAQDRDFAFEQVRLEILHERGIDIPITSLKRVWESQLINEKNGVQPSSSGMTRPRGVSSNPSIDLKKKLFHRPSSASSCGQAGSGKKKIKTKRSRKNMRTPPWDDFATKKKSSFKDLEDSLEEVNSIFSGAQNMLHSIQESTPNSSIFKLILRRIKSIDKKKLDELLSEVLEMFDSV